MTLYDDRGNYLVGGQLPLATKKERQIPNDRRLERPPQAMLAAKDMVLRFHPTAQVRSLTSAYNCMGMVFATRRTTITTEELSMILEDDDYQLSSESDVMPGDVVVYRNEEGSAVHVGLVAEVRVNLWEGRRNIKVLSQWGANGEYFHRIDDVNPMLGTPTEFWTDRR